MPHPCRAGVLPLLAVLSLLACVAAPIAGQSRTTSAIRGRVTDTAGNPIESASVRVRHMGTGAERITGTNQDGRFLVLLLQPGGPYTLTIQALGYADATQEEIQLQVGETWVQDFVLETQAIQLEGIRVEADKAEIFNPSQVGPATLLNERVVESVPILSRDIMELAVLSPLVKTTEGGGFSVAGQNDRYNSLLIDGVLNKDVFGLTSGGVPGGQAGGKLIPLDAVAQYEILVAPFDVRLSGFTGGVMNAVTRSGTNEWFTRFFGVVRDEVLMGDLTLPTGPVEASGVDRQLLGLSVGGPIITDKAHFFVSGEFERRRQPPTGFNLFRDSPLTVRISEETVNTIGEQLDGQFGLKAGDAGPYPLEQELGNAFARMDWAFDNGQRLTVRNIFAYARNDQSPNRAAFEPYELSSNAVFRTATTNTTSVQLFSPLGDRGANELNLSLHRSTDETEAASDFPQIQVDAISTIAGAPFGREIRAGAQFFAQDNNLEQTVLRLTDHVTLVHRDTDYVLGVTGAYYDFNQRYLPGASGDYFYASLADLGNNAPQRYQRSFLAEGASPEVGFNVAEAGVFAQAQLDADEGLTLRFGLRVDAPFVLDQPAENPEILGEFGLSTSALPSGNILISPRWGFNWQSEGERTTQVRGGAGMFVGQPPFVWLSNAFQNNGLRSFSARCVGRVTDDPMPGTAVPQFDPLNPPTQCENAPFIVSRTVTVFAPDFKYPQDLKFSAVVDQELSDRLSFSVGALFSKAINQIVLEEVNLGSPTQPPGPLRGYGGEERRIVGNPVDDGFRPVRKLPGYEQVLMAKNESQDWTFSVTGEFRGQITDYLAFQTGYSFSRSWDRMSLVATDMISNFGFTPTFSHPNQARVTTSNFDRPHKFVASIYGAPIPGLEETRLSLLYTGQSGAPFSYVYRGDLNGDGYAGFGPAFDRNNDLIYIPERASEIPSGVATLRLVQDAIENQECLRDYRGTILRRNVCRAPFQHRLDLRLSQTVQMGGAEIRLEGDMINILNFLNRDWGRVETVRALVPLLEPVSRIECGRGCTGELTSRWAGGALPTEEGSLRAAEPFSVVTPDSQWQAQFGVRVTFGGERR
jgi:hypothetical protein